MRLNIPRVTKTLAAFLTENPIGTRVNFSGLGFMLPRDSFDGLGDTSLITAEGNFGFALGVEPGSLSYQFDFNAQNKDFSIYTYERVGSGPKRTYIIANNFRVYDGMKANASDTDILEPDSDVLDMFSKTSYADLSFFNNMYVSVITGASSIARLTNIGIQVLSSTLVDFVNTRPEFSIEYGGSTSEEMYGQTDSPACGLGDYMLSKEGEDYRYGQCYIQVPPMLSDTIYKYAPVYFDKLDYSISPAFSYADANAIALYDISADNYALVQMVDYEVTGSGQSTGGIQSISSNGLKIYPTADGNVELNGTNLYMVDETNKKKAVKK
jgi:hypothetical protein